MAHWNAGLSLRLRLQVQPLLPLQPTTRTRSEPCTAWQQAYVKHSTYLIQGDLLAPVYEWNKSRIARGGGYS